MRPPPRRGPNRKCPAASGSASPMAVTWTLRPAGSGTLTLPALRTLTRRQERRGRPSSSVSRSGSATSACSRDPPRGLDPSAVQTYTRPWLIGAPLQLRHDLVTSTTPAGGPQLHGHGRGHHP